MTDEAKEATVETGEKLLSHSDSNGIPIISLSECEELVVCGIRGPRIDQVKWPRAHKITALYHFPTDIIVDIDPRVFGKTVAQLLYEFGNVDGQSLSFMDIAEHVVPNGSTIEKKKWCQRSRVDLMESNGPYEWMERVATH